MLRGLRKRGFSNLTPSNYHFRIEGLIQELRHSEYDVSAVNKSFTWLLGELIDRGELDNCKKLIGVWLENENMEVNSSLCSLFTQVYCIDGNIEDAIALVEKSSHIFIPSYRVSKELLTCAIAGEKVNDGIVYRVFDLLRSVGWEVRSSTLTPIFAEVSREIVSTSSKRGKISSLAAKAFIGSNNLRYAGCSPGLYKLFNASHHLINPLKSEYSMIINCLLLENYPSLALKVLESYNETGERMDSSVYNKILHKSAECGDFASARNVLSTMGLFGLSGNEYTFSKLIVCAGTGGHIDEAIHILYVLNSKGYQPTNYAYEALLTKAIQSKNMKATIEMIQMIRLSKNEDLDFNQIYNAVISNCRRSEGKSFLFEKQVMGLFLPLVKFDYRTLNRLTRLMSCKNDAKLINEIVKESLCSGDIDDMFASILKLKIKEKLIKKGVTESSLENYFCFESLSEFSSPSLLSINGK